MNAKLFVLGLGLVGLTAVGAGCGSDDEKTTNTNSANTNAAVTNTNNANTANANTKMEEGETIADLAMDNDDLSTLVTALETAELVDMFTDEEMEYTVFAPTNDAFAEVQDTVDELLMEENMDDLKDVLQYHVVEGTMMAEDLEDGDMLTTLNGDKLEVTVEEDGTVMIGDAMVTEADMEASNGVVHVVDMVLMPSEDDTEEVDAEDDAALEEETMEEDEEEMEETEDDSYDY